MKTVYTASDVLEGHIVSNMLRANNIDAHLDGVHLQGGVGELMASDFAKVRVAESDFEAAKVLIATYEARRPEQQRNNIARDLLLPILGLGLILLGILIF